MIPDINMEDKINNNAINEQVINRKVKAKASNIINKFKSIQDRKAFCK